MSKTVLILSFSYIHRDPRVLRQIQWLRERFRIIVGGFSDPELEGVEFRQLLIPPGSLLSRLKRSAKKLMFPAEMYYWSLPEIKHAIREFSNEKHDLIICNDIETLPLGIKIRKNAKVIFDAHEFAPLHFEHLWYWRLLNKSLNISLCKKYIPRCDDMTTVSPGLSRGYEDLCCKKTNIITNATIFHDLAPLDVGIKIKIVHHGAANRARNLEGMIELAKYLDDRFELYFVLVETSKNYIEELKQKASSFKNVYFLDPVKTTEISNFLNQFDIGVFLVPPVTYNLRHTLPNKLFEFIQARLAIAIGPSPDMGEVVKKYGLGVISNDFSPKSLASELNKLTHDEIMRFKEAANRAAEFECAEVNKEKFLDLVNSLT